jgi:hypothetical protein
MDANYEDLTSDQKNYLSNLKIPVWELIIRNSGGHPSITNISGLNFLAYNKAAMEVGYKTDKYTDIMRMIVDEFIKSLKQVPRGSSKLLLLTLTSTHRIGLYQCSQIASHTRKLGQLLLKQSLKTIRV